ncbi:lysoplasmalogenase family protein [Lacinutrix neustonica]|uniref:lysoplasmalogenase family protein n=1 Tax=Lacinutrix neustonica TaxID=2980107 RepID=UPI0036F3C437
MSFLFKNVTAFSLLFITIILFDVYVKLNLETVPYRFISKPLIIISLLTFYIFNNKETSRQNFNFMAFALIVFSIGNVLLIIYTPKIVYISGLLFFVVGKIFYILRFSNQRDFTLSRLIPFVIICFFI